MCLTRIGWTDTFGLYRMLPIHYPLFNPNRDRLLYRIVLKIVCRITWRANEKRIDHRMAEISRCLSEHIDIINVKR